MRRSLLPNEDLIVAIVFVLIIAGNGCGKNGTTSPIGSIDFPANVSLASPDNVTTTALTLRWSRNLDPEFLRYEIHASATQGLSPSASSFLESISIRTDTSRRVTALSPATTYYFRIRSVDSHNEFTDSNELQVFTNSTPFAVLISPISSTTDTSALISWDPYPDSDFQKYEVHSSTTSSFSPSPSTLRVTVDNQSTTHSEVTDVIVGQLNYFRVRIINTLNNYADSEERSAVIGVAFPISNVSFSQHVQMLFNFKCATSGCHSGGTPASNLNLESPSYSKLMNYQPALVLPGDGTNSRLIQLFDGRATPTMPPNSTLRPVYTDGLRTWINEGALNN